MPEIRFLPSDVTVSAVSGETLLDAAKRAGLDVDTPCGGNGTCGRCLAQVVEGNLTQPVSAALPDSLRENGWVLACMAAVGECFATVRMPEGALENESSHETGAGFESIGPEFFPCATEAEFAARNLEIEIPKPRAGDGLSDLDRLTRSIAAKTGSNNVRIPLQTLASIPETLRMTDRHRLHYTRDGGILNVVGLDAGGDEYGLAVDFGTTTVEAALVGRDKKILARASRYNAQISCGSDVISRINYAKTDLRRRELKEKAAGTINSLIASVCESAGADPKKIYSVSIAANTTMVHLLLGIVPEYIRLSPYTPAVYGVPRLTAGEIGIDAAPGAVVLFAPSVGSYVGGDIVSGLTCTPLSAAFGGGVSLFMDLGTNGEIVLGDGEFLMACACSAGPAFEGGGISCGMRAERGAVCGVEMLPGGEPRLIVIGGGKPKGICGSGMISLTAELFKKGFLEPNGKLKSGMGNASNGEICLADGLRVGEADFQNLIRAKAAVFSACRTLLKNAGINFGEIECLYVAGGFGRRLNMDDARAIGLIPKLPAERVRYIGNASLAGAYFALISEKNREMQDELTKRITYVDLSDEPGYMDEYTAALFLPHTDSGLFI